MRIFVSSGQIRIASFSWIIFVMKHTHLIMIIVALSICCAAQAISLVYNLKIRRAFNLGQILGDSPGVSWVGTAVPIVYSRSRTIDDADRNLSLEEKRLVVGSLFNLRVLVTKNWWAEVSTGLENEFAKSEGSVNFNKSAFGIDDLIFSGGYNFFGKKHTQFVLYGLTGIPLRQKIGLEDAQDALIGTRFYSLGIGSEFSYSVIQSLPKSLSFFFQNRFLHFFPRKWDPILPVGGRILPGNVTDVLFAGRYRFVTNIIETGYNSTFFNNQALKISPFQKIDGKNYVRHGWYASYSRGFKKFPLLPKKPGLIGAGMLVSRSKRFNTKILSGWLNLTILF